MRIRTRTIIGAVLAVLMVAAAAAAVFLGVRFADMRAVAQARESSLSAAKQYAENMFGYNAANIDDHIAKSMSVLTGGARGDYEKTMSENKVADEVKKQQVVSQVALQSAGVVTNTEDTATVLIFMNQSVSRSGNQVIRVDPSRLTFEMTRRDGRWLIAGINVLTDDSFRSLLQREDNPPPNAIPLNPPNGADSATAPAPAPPVPSSGLPVPGPASPAPAP